jgi:hypothetical protein
LQLADILDASAAEGLMLDDSLRQSKVYFQLLHLLRVIPLWMRETRYDLENLRTKCNDVLVDIPEAKNHISVRENWDEVMKHFDGLENDLQKRIEAKTDELRGLREGVIQLQNPTPWMGVSFRLRV